MSMGIVADIKQSPLAIKHKKIKQRKLQGRKLQKAGNNISFSGDGAMLRLSTTVQRWAVAKVDDYDLKCA
jgi:hypothetical protein